MRSRKSSCWSGLGRATTIALIFCLLSTSTPAAPQMIAALAKESSVSFAFWFRARGLSKLIQGSGTTNASRQEKQADRNAKVTRIQIFPGDITLQIDQSVHLSAVAYDGNDAPVSGVNIKWTANDEGRKRSGPITPQGEFRAIVPGTFKITAEGAGQKAGARIIVENGQRRPKVTDTPTNVRPVSNRERPKGKANLAPRPAENTTSAKGNKRRSVRRTTVQASPTATRKAASFAHGPGSSTTVAAMPDVPEDGWTDDNYWSSSEPGDKVGDPPGSPLDGGAGSGNFQFAAPILGLPGRGISISLGAAYNSRLWNKAGSQITYDIDRSWPAPGFSLGFGKLLGMGVYNGGMLVDADGTRHAYTGSVSAYGSVSHFVGHTTDGSFIDYSYFTGSGGGIVSAEARLANGTVITYGAPGPGAVYPTQIEDANGNYITITYVGNAGPRIQTITDTLNRAITFYYDSNNLLTAIKAPALGSGTRELVRFHYHQLSLSYGFSGLTTVVRDSNPWVIDAIYYPATSTGYWFGDTDSYSSYGMLAKVVEQRGMGFSASSLTDMGSVSQGQTTRTESYNYPLTADNSLTDAPTYTSMTESWTRDGTNVDSATTGYDVHENSTPRTVTITLPNGTTSKQYSYNHSGQYDDGLVYSDETRDSSSTLLQSSSSTWAEGAYGSPRPTRVEKTDERGQTTAAEFSYGSFYNQVTEVRDFDYGGTTLLRATRTGYENGSNYTGSATSFGYVGRHIFNLPLNVEVYAGDNTTKVSQTDYQYDGQTLTDTPNVVMHDDTHNPNAPQYEVCDCNQWDEWQINCLQWNCYWRSDYDPATVYRGNVTQVTSYANATPTTPTGPITETRRYDITGNLVTASTACCEQTSFRYGTDADPAATQYAYVLSKTRGSATDAYAQVTTSATYDFYTGLGLSATDANGRQSQTSYDSATLRPATSTSPTGAHTDFAYDDAAMTVTSTTYLASGEGGGIADQSVKYLNGMGQVRQEKARGVNNTWDFVDTIYNNLGQVYQQSRPYRGGDTQQWTTATYDALGRTRTVTAPDESVSQTFYNEISRPDVASSTAGETTRVQDAWGRERWGRTDASGRLVEVVEPNPGGNGSVSSSGLVTTYAYNTLGNLTTVNQGAQTRSFAYDSLGRLTAQKLAEQSATLNDAGTYVGSGTWSDVFTYDTRSNLTSRTDARGVKTVYTYNSDPLNRLQSVSWDTSGFGDTGNPIVSAATVSYSYRTKSSGGQLLDVTQLSSVTAAGVSTESYGFDAEGRVSSKTLTLSSRSSYPFVTDYSYDSLDRATDVRYPAEYLNGSQPRKVVHHDYDIASRLTGLTYDSQSFASSIVYNAASQTTSLNVGSGANQIAENYSYNAQTGLLDNQTVTRGTTLLNLSYDYAGANGKRTGQLTKILNNLNHNKDRGYSYDALGRLVQATGGPSSSPLWSQSYSYDRYGNRTAVTASGNSAKNERGGAGSAGVSPALSAQNQRGSSPTVREGSGTEPGAVATGSITEPSDPRVILPSDLLAKNNTVELLASARDDSKPLSDSPSTLRAPSAPQSGPPTFTDDPLKDPQNPESFKIKALHLTELRTAINLLRARLGMSNYPWQQPSATGGAIQIGGPVTAAPIVEMRIALDQALGAPSPAYAGGLAQYQPILAVHVQELRDRIKSAWDAAGSSCPAGQTLLIDQYVKNFYQGALARQPNANELQSWSSQLRQAYYLGQTQLRAAAQYMGRQLFKSQEYANRGRDNHWYVYDLYWAYLQRQPDTSGWNFWEGVINSDIQNGLDGREHARVAFETDGTEFFPKLATLCAGSSASAPIPLDGLANLTYDAATNHITTAGFTYDAAGNQTRTLRTDGSAQRFQYDAANRLIQVRDDYGYTLETFTYGDSNERLIAEESGWRTYYACGGGAEYIESSSSSTPTWSKSYVYLGGRLLATLIPNGSGGEAVQYHHPDRLGTRLVTDPSNATSFEQVTLPFGTALNAESTGATNRRFTSYDRSVTTGLDYANNRHYDSQQGRFTQVDPIGMSAASLVSPQSLNLYAYCGNDPINHVDPSGLFWGKLLGFVNKVIKWLKVAVAVAIIVLTIMLAPELAGIAIAKALGLAGALLGSALGPRWLQTAITVGFAALGIYLQGPQIIWNFAQAGASVSDRVLSAIGWLNVVGTVTRYLGDTPQKRSDTTGDKDIKPPGVKTESLTPCVQKYLSKFFGGPSLAGIQIQRDYLPPIAPSDARAFTSTGDLISFNKGEYQPNTIEGIALIGHEITHNFQARKYGDARFGLLYLGDSAVQWVRGRDAYLGNRFEKEAFAKEKEIRADLDKHGNPCP
jgi:RHS repeat-associated protein